MDRISGLSDELLVKILVFLPTNEVVSTSILSKRWEFLWMCVPKLKFVMNHYGSDLPLRDFITKNLPLLKPQVIESFHLQCFDKSFQPEDIKHWVGTSISRCVRDLIINYFDLSLEGKPVVLLPSSLYTCKSLVTLRLTGNTILVDVPRTVCLPSLKTLELGSVGYSNEDSLRLLLSYCPVLEDLTIKRDRHDNVKTLVIIVPSLLRLTLPIDGAYSCDGYVIVTPALKYFKVSGLYREGFSYLIMHMPKVEEAKLRVEEDVERLFESITSVKRLSLFVLLDIEDESMYHNGIFFNHLEHLKLRIHRDNWSKLLIRLLEDSPKLRVLKLLVDGEPYFDEEFEHVSWKYDDPSFVPKCLLDSLEIFEFAGYTGRPEERDFVSYWATAESPRFSKTINSMLQLKVVISDFLYCDVGNGERADHGQLITFLGAAGPRQLRLSQDARVVDASRNGDWFLPPARSDNIQSFLTTLTGIDAPVGSNGPDYFLWRKATGSFSSTFSAKDTWEQLRVRSPLVPWAKVVWFKEHVPRFSFITWLAFLGRLPLRDRLRRWGMSVPSACVLCSHGDDTHAHLFFDCPFSTDIWSFFSRKFLPNPPSGLDAVSAWILNLQPATSHIAIIL